MSTDVAPVHRLLLPAEYAHALGRLHAGLRQTDVTMPHVMERVAETQRDVASRDITPDLTETDRTLLADTLRDLRGSIVDRRAAPEQLLHGEPHPWNVLDTNNGGLHRLREHPYGPVEYDLGWVPTAVSDRYGKAHHDLANDCRGLVLAIVAMHRWRLGDSTRAAGDQEWRSSFCGRVQYGQRSIPFIGKPLGIVPRPDGDRHHGHCVTSHRRTISGTRIRSGFTWSRDTGSDRACPPGLA